MVKNVIKIFVLNFFNDFISHIRSNPIFIFSRQNFPIRCNIKIGSFIKGLPSRYFLIWHFRIQKLPSGPVFRGFGGVGVPQIVHKLLFLRRHRLALRPFQKRLPLRGLSRVLRRACGCGRNGSPKGSGYAAALWALLCLPFRKGKEKAGSAIGAACHVLSFYCVIARCLLPALLPVQTTLQLYPQYRDGDHLNTDLAFFTHP